MTINDTIKKIVSEEIKIQVLMGKVKSVDESKMVCDIDLETAPDLLDVRLRSIIDSTDKGVLIVPKKDSVVLVGIIENRIESAFVLSFSEVEKIRLITDEIELAGKDFKGLVKVEDLTQKLNNLENAFNNLVADFNAHTHNAPQAPSGTLATLPPLVPSTQNVANTQVSDLENEKVKHG